VFRGEEQRQHRHTILKAFLAVILALIFAWCLKSAFTDIAEPPQAKADTESVQIVQADANASQNADTVSAQPADQR
jgi:hypothetical protein